MRENTDKEEDVWTKKEGKRHGERVRRGGKAE